MDIKDILNVFSNRKKNKNKDNIKIEISQQTRNRILMALAEIINSSHNCSFSSLMLEVKKMFHFKNGTMVLINKGNNEYEEIINYVLMCDWISFLDFIEYIFKTQTCDGMIGNNKCKMVEDINYIFQQDSVPFQLTNYIEEWIEEESTDYRFRNAICSRRNVIAIPQIIEKDDDFTYSEIVKPVLEVLKDTRFSNSNKEFLESLEHYRRGRYKECITSCCSSLESAIKVICTINKWQYNQNATVNPLVLFIVDKAGLPKWYENVLNTPGTIRNKIGSSHGKGEQNIVATKNEARYQINITASGIIFLFDQIL